MSQVEKTREDNSNIYESLKALYYSGKVKPSLHKILAALENEPEHLALTLLACQCLERTKDFETLSSYADEAIKLDPQNAEAYYYKGVALQHVKGKEQRALKNFNEALTLDPDNTAYLKSLATTHLLLFKDYDLPLKFAEKHRLKAEESLLKIVELLENKESPSYREYWTLAEVNMMMSQALNSKMYYLRAVSAYESTGEDDQDKNIYKDIVKAQKANIKLLEKFTE